MSFNAILMCALAAAIIVPILGAMLTLRFWLAVGMMLVMMLVMAWVLWVFGLLYHAIFGQEKAMNDKQEDEAVTALINWFQSQNIEIEEAPIVLMKAAVLLTATLAVPDRDALFESITALKMVVEVEARKRWKELME